MHIGNAIYTGKGKMSSLVLKVIVLATEITRSPLANHKPTIFASRVRSMQENCQCIQKKIGLLLKTKPQVYLLILHLGVHSF